MDDGMLHYQGECSVTSTGGELYGGNDILIFKMPMAYYTATFNTGSSQTRYKSTAIFETESK